MKWMFSILTKGKWLHLVINLFIVINKRVHHIHHLHKTLIYLPSWNAILQPLETVHMSNRVILVIPLATLLLSQWVFGFIFVLPSPTQHGILLAGLRSLLTREDVSVRIVPVNKHQTSGKLLVAKHCTSKVIFILPSDDLNVQFISICL